MVVMWVYLSKAIKAYKKRVQFKGNYSSLILSFNGLISHTVRNKKVLIVSIDFAGNV